MGSSGFGIGNPDAATQIRLAVIEIIKEEFENNPELEMPQGFLILYPRTFTFIIKGPIYVGLDAWDYIEGIKISCWGIKEAKVYGELPHFNHKIEKKFEYANPKFPKNLADYVSNELAIWTIQNQLEQEKEHQETEENVRYVIGFRQPGLPKR